MFLSRKLCLLHAESYGGRGSTLLVTASIARDEQSRHSTHSQGTGVQTGIVTLMTGIEIGLQSHSHTI